MWHLGRPVPRSAPADSSDAPYYQEVAGRGPCLMKRLLGQGCEAFCEINELLALWFKG